MVKAQRIQKQEQGDAKYGASPFADLTEEEFRTNYLSPVWDTSYNSFLKPAKIPTESPPDSFDWRDHDAVTPVKNQGMCGSCWAFSTTGNIEGVWAIHKKELVSLSEQELVDCDKVDLGCNGGLPSQAYEQIIKIGGLETEDEYPYEGKNDKCEFDKTEVKVKINGAVNISSNEDEMKAWLWKNGPISSGLNANAMQFYLGGVSHPFSFLCNPESLDHGVLITGYGIKKGWFSDTPYWAIKNSWGESWGEKGYYLLYRGAGVCGVNKMPTSATVE
jgi:cathepsin F